MSEVLLKKVKLIEGFRISYNKIIDGYQSKELDEKIKAVNKLDDLFKEVLKLFKSVKKEPEKLMLEPFQDP